jgi:glycosyltransferase involved in cell wall biosynthesis
VTGDSLNFPTHVVNRFDTELGSQGRPKELVTVVVTCYNQGRFLPESIGSLLSQTRRPDEILLVDDGSTDNTRDQVRRFPEVIYIRQDNAGLAAARNTGLRRSRGDLLVFLDADDRLVSQALEAGLDDFAAHPECAFVFGAFRKIDASGKPLAERAAMRRLGEDAYLGLLRNNKICMHATAMFRRRALEAVGGYDTSLPACEDYDLYLKIARRFPAHQHARLVAEYRMHPGQMSVRLRMMLNSAKRVLLAQRKFVRENRIYTRAIKTGIKNFEECYGNLMLDRVKEDWRMGRRKEVLAGLWRLLRDTGHRARYWSLIRKHAPRLLGVRDSFGRLLPTRAVRFGDFRRLVPFSREFGFDRGTPVDRFYIDWFLSCCEADIRGRVLEIGDNSYTKRFGGNRVTHSDVLHVQEGNPQATFIGDLTSAEHIPSDVFDCIILTQTLHLIYDMKAAMRTLYRILKPGGVLLATVPGISQLERGLWKDAWYWSLTILSTRRLAEEAFPRENVEVESHGNVLAATAFLMGLAAEELDWSELEHRDPLYQLLVTLRAAKPPAPL